MKLNFNWWRMVMQKFLALSCHDAPTTAAAAAVLFTSRCVASGSCEFFRIFHFHASVVSFVKHTVRLTSFLREFGSWSGNFFLLRISSSPPPPEWFFVEMIARVCACACLFICIPFRIHALMVFFSINATVRATWLQTADGIYWFISAFCYIIVCVRAAYECKYTILSSI